MIRPEVANRLEAIMASYEEQDYLEKAWQDGFEAGSQDEDALDIARDEGYDEAKEELLSSLQAWIDDHR